MSSVSIKLDGLTNVEEIDLPASDYFDDILYDIWGEDYVSGDYHIDVVGVDIDNGIDYNLESDFLGFKDVEDLDDLSNIVERIESLYDNDLINAIIEATGYDIYVVLNYAESVYSYLTGVDTLEDCAIQLVDDGTMGEVSSSLYDYIDFEKLGNDLRYDGYYETSYGVLYIG